jgi:hypothetical protein
MHHDLHLKMSTVLQVPGEHIDKLRIKSRAPNGDHVPDDEQSESDGPELQADANRGCDRAADDCE